VSGTNLDSFSKTVVGLAVFRRLDYRIRTWGVLLVAYATGFATLATLGLGGSRRLYLLGLPVVALVLLGERSGMLMSAVSILTMLGFTLSANQTGLINQLISERSSLRAGDWLAESSDTLMLMVVIMVVLILFYRFQERLIGREVHTLAELLRTQALLEDQNTTLEQKIEDRSVFLPQAPFGFRLEVINSCAPLLINQNFIEQAHRYNQALPEVEQGKDVLISPDFICDISNASPLHDIGKVAIPDNIPLKPGRLTPEEFEEMKPHTVIGTKTLEDVKSLYPGNSFINLGISIARSRYERWDGNGYPDQLAGDKIPLAARIMSVADVYDALRSKRCYKESLTRRDCKEMIVNGRGS